MVEVVITAREVVVLEVRVVVAGLRGENGEFVGA